ncbi:MAG TPA: DUF1353 domain-containing protein, partial [Gemmatimonadaceae bacterium]
QNWEYELLEDVAYQAPNRVVLVPRMFSYDGASIPSWAWRVIYTPFDPIVMLPALVHDWIYLSHEVTKPEADLVLRDLLRRNGVPGWRQFLIYWAVRLAGAFAWRNSAQDLAYANWLKGQLYAAGVDVSRYRWP